MKKVKTKVKIYVLPGGQMPKRQTDGAIGYDVCLRAIVCAHEMDPSQPVLRKTLFDFEKEPGDEETRKHVESLEGNLVYRLNPGETALGGIGFVTEMKFPMFYWVAPRSGLASKWGITVTNAPGTVDPDYRGEAGVVIENRSKQPFYLKQNMRIAQVIFQTALIPEVDVVERYEDLESSSRGAGGFGSTGLGGK